MPRDRPGRGVRSGRRRLIPHSAGRAGAQTARPLRRDDRARRGRCPWSAQRGAQCRRRAVPHSVGRAGSVSPRGGRVRLACCPVPGRPGVCVARDAGFRAETAGQGPSTVPPSCRHGRTSHPGACAGSGRPALGLVLGRAPCQSSSTAVLCRTTRCVASSIRWADAPGSSGRSSMREASSAMCRSGWWTVVSGGLDHWASGTSS